jgi:hypothetical protein
MLLTDLTAGLGRSAGNIALRSSACFAIRESVDFQKSWKSRRHLSNRISRQVETACTPQAVC